MACSFITKLKKRTLILKMPVTIAANNLRESLFSLKSNFKKKERILCTTVLHW